MKNIFKIVIVTMMTLGLLNAEPIEQNGEKNGYEIKLTSNKPLTTGENNLFVELSKEGSSVSDAKVKIKVFMPEMPGMPYMEYEAKAKFVDGKYKMGVNFSMGGTWQYHLKFKSKDGKVHTVRGSVNI